MPDRAINFALYQLAWLACVLGAAQGWPRLGAGIGLAFVAIHVVSARRRGDELLLVAAGALVGLVVDRITISVGALDLSIGAVVPGWSPPWMIVLWMGFVTTFRFSMRWIAGRVRPAIAFGALGGPIAFWAGERLEAARIGEDRALAFLVIGVAWAAALPLLAQVATWGGGPEGHYRRPGGDAEDSYDDEL